MTARLLPTFLIVGAPKAGTTSLHAYLAEHPEIAMTAVKEPMIFEPPDWERRLADYEPLFDRDAAVRGESSTAYAAFPWVPEIPDRVRATVPDMRIIYIVRDPIARTLSHYAQNLWDGKPVPALEDLMSDLEDPMNMPVWCSRYATQIERWLDRFGPERVLVLDQRELLAERNATIRRVLEFLGVDARFTSPAWDAEHNTAAEHRRPSDLGRRLPRLARGPLRAVATRPIPKPVLTADQQERLVALLRPEAERFAALTGLRIDHWSL